jgi:hypothetical protein
VSRSRSRLCLRSIHANVDSPRLAPRCKCTRRASGKSLVDQAFSPPSVQTSANATRRDEPKPPRPVTSGKCQLPGTFQPLPTTPKYSGAPHNREVDGSSPSPAISTEAPGNRGCCAKPAVGGLCSFFGLRSGAAGPASEASRPVGGAPLGVEGGVELEEVVAGGDELPFGAAGL